MKLIQKWRHWELKILKLIGNDMSNRISYDGLASKRKRFVEAIYYFSASNGIGGNFSIKVLEIRDLKLLLKKKFDKTEIK